MLGYDTVPVHETIGGAVAAFIRDGQNVFKFCNRYFFDGEFNGFIDLSYDNGWSGCEIIGPPPRYGTTGRDIAKSRFCPDRGAPDYCNSAKYATTPKNLGVPTPSQAYCGNPASPLTGHKFQEETDFEVPGSPWLTFKRYLNTSYYAKNRSFGFGMSHSFDYALIPSFSGTDFELIRPDGRSIKFSSSYKADADEMGALSPSVDESGLANGWLFDTENGQVETYDLKGRITKADSKVKCNTLDFSE